MTYKCKINTFKVTNQSKPSDLIKAEQLEFSTYVDSKWVKQKIYCVNSIKIIHQKGLQL